jgi:hypothetical protein
MYKLFTIAFFCLLLVSCKKESTKTLSPITNNPTSCSQTISYKNEVEPMIKMYCLGCHSSNQTSGGINLSGYSNTSTHASRSLNSIKNGSMPPVGSIPDSLIQKLNCWINQGKLNN